MERRSLDFRDADAIIAEIRRLRSGGYARLGKWNLAQICEHITATLRLGLDGADRRMPRVLRTLVFGPMVRHVIRSRRMISGVPAPKGLVPAAASGHDEPTAIDACIATLERARDAVGPLPPHPMADMTVDQWRQLNWVHAAHHLGFLVPHDGTPTTTRAGSDASALPT